MDKDTDKPPRPQRTRTRRNGRDVLVKRPDSAENAKPATVYLWHGLGSGFLKGRPDMRSAVGKATRDREAHLLAHVGDDPSVPLARCCTHAARFSILGDAVWERIKTLGSQEVAPEVLQGLLDALVRISREEVAVLRLLGLSRRAKDVPTLQDYLRQKAAEKEQETQQPAQTEEPHDA